MNTPKHSTPQDQPGQPHNPGTPPQTIAFESIAQGQTEVLIEYQGQVYRLRCTRNNKLILNK